VNVTISQGSILLDLIVKCVTVASLIAAGVSAFLAARSYGQSVRLKRAEWLRGLHQQFYESDRYREMRRILDYESDRELSRIQKNLEEGQQDAYVDQLFAYLNFFEFVAGLLTLKQVTFDDLMLLFEYHLHVIARNHTAFAQVVEGGYEKLAGLLLDRRFASRRPYIFVYGTLRGSAASQWPRGAANNARRLGSGTVPGLLFRLDDYPGMILSDGDELVRGEVYRLNDPMTAWLALDKYEGCGPDHAVPYEFERRLAWVHLENGEEMDAWTYVYCRDTSGKPRIESGDYLQPVNR
jgi:gamma-glutamylcyclotransferase (GGCT)/AIG2-like uncharacterized protein YtfP